jgi:large subunit ribosomal protein L9
VQVVLLERVEKLGQMGDVVNVRDGYARNYLVPQGKALRATKGNLAEFEKRRVQLEAANLKRKEEAEGAVGHIEGRMVTVLRQAGEGGQLYGSVNARDVAQALTEDGVTVSRHQVRLEMALKALGLHQVRIALHPEVLTWITVNVARSMEEAEIQADPELAAALEAREVEEQAALAAEAAEPGPLNEPV